MGLPELVSPDQRPPRSWWADTSGDTPHPLIWAPRLRFAVTLKIKLKAIFLANRHKSVSLIRKKYYQDARGIQLYKQIFVISLKN